MIEMRPRIYEQSLNLDWRPPNSYVRTGIRGTLASDAERTPKFQSKRKPG
ncbi:hypothetical protein F444_15136 [Phytophthora nicotianae P1976]|uniref:Uncharacterized protein n=1 Tax=Phytophthora nicotianae P1976 TaxID=1317066 RepID=A0A080ZMZ3_PHYNI|nr:hypothetical protein F444_15136 [Phytophthora nicotianae P1976]